MKKFNAILMVILFAVLLVNTGCKKEGCTDPDSINYDSEAKKDDGSCEYEATVQFWYDEEFSNYLLEIGDTIILIYFDNELIGSYDLTEYYDSAPECGLADVYKTKYLGNSKTKDYNYKITDYDGNEILGGTVLLDASTPCLQIKLQP